MAVTITRTLDVLPGGIPVVVSIKQYTSDFTLVFNILTSGGVLAFENGTSCQLRSTKHNGDIFQKSGVRSGSKITFSGDAEMTSATGDQEFEVVLVKDDKELHLSTFVLRVYATAVSQAGSDESSEQQTGINIAIDGTILIIS